MSTEGVCTCLHPNFSLLAEDLLLSFPRAREVLTRAVKRVFGAGELGQKPRAGINLVWRALGKAARSGLRSLPERIAISETEGRGGTFPRAGTELKGSGQMFAEVRVCPNFCPISHFW